MAPGEYFWARRAGGSLLLFATLLVNTPTKAADQGVVGTDASSVSLRIETGMHIAPIRAIAADREGRYAVTASEDKTARIWDVATSRLLQVFRPPSGSANDGKLFSVSMAPDGQLFATSGWSAGNDVYVVNRTNAEIVHRITGLPNVATALAFSPDGRYLAVGLWGQHGVRLFSSADGWHGTRELGGDSEVGGDIHALVWSPDGKRLAASSADGTLRLYELGDGGVRLAVRRPATGSEVPFGLAFSPDGARLAVGSANAASFLVLDSVTLKAVTAVTGGGTAISGGMNAIAWSADGQQIYAAGTRRAENGGFPLCVWKQGSATCVSDAPIARNTITMLAPLPGGRTLFSTAEPAWGVFDERGSVARRSGPELADFRNLRSQFRLSRDGTGVAVRAGPAGQGADRAVAFSMTALAWTSSGRDWAEPRAKSGRTSVTSWFEQRQPNINGRTVRLDANELSLSTSVSKGGERVAIGTNFFVRCYDEAGHELWRASAPGSTWQVNISGDGRWLVAGFSDGSLRWYRMRDGDEQLSLLPHPDGKRWIAWSRQGYYAASVGGEDLIGWQVERGSTRAADFFSVSRFRTDYYRPELISDILVRGDFTAALDSVAKEQGRPPAGKPVTERLPPSVRIASPEDGKHATGSTARVQVVVQTPGGAPVTGMRARVNGIAVSLPELAALRGRSAEAFELPIPLPDSDADVMIFAENRHGVSPAAVVRVLRPAARPEAPAEKKVPRKESVVASSAAPNEPSPLAADLRPALYVLAVGVSEYADKAIQLEYSAKDATDLAGLLKAQEGALYRKVSVRLLTDGKAKRDDVLDGLEWIRREMTARDVGVVFLAGHGVNDSDGIYYYLPHDTEVKRLKRTGVIFTEIRNTLVSLPGKALFFVDTCHSGNVLGTGLRALPNDTTAIVNELSSAENGVIVFTATTGRQYAQESETWGNGAFTKALVEGLRGKADMAQSGRVTHKMLDLYVSERVKGLTDGAQSPVTITPAGVPDFPLSIPHKESDKAR